MKHSLSLVVTILLLASLSRAQVFDFSNGNDGSIILPCLNGAVGKWIEEEASLYPIGPQKGLVLTSDPRSSSCLATSDVITVTPDSKFHTLMRVPYKLSYDKMQVWLVEKERPTYRYEWFSISGPIESGEEWIEISQDILSSLPITFTGDFTLEIWDSSSTTSISIRYFIISEVDLIKTTAPAPETTPQTTTEVETSVTTTTSDGMDCTTDSETSVTEATSGTEANGEESEETSSTETTEHVTEATSGTEANGEESEEKSSTETMEYVTEANEDSSSDLSSDSTAPSPGESSDEQSTQSPGGTFLGVWGVVIGVAIGVFLISVIFCVGGCCWWLMFGKRRRKEAQDQLVSLPRLEFLSSVSHSGSDFSIVGRDDYWPRSNNWSYKM